MINTACNGDEFEQIYDCELHSAIDKCMKRKKDIKENITQRN